MSDGQPLSTLSSGRRVLVIGTALLVVGSGIGFAAWALRSQEAGPPRPAWVRPNGLVDPSKVPAWIEVLKGDGTDAIWGWMRGADTFADPGQGPILVYDKPAGRVIGQLDVSKATSAASQP
jgi:hypothetical protein